MSKSAKTYKQPTREEIAACAYRIYETEGRPHDRQQHHWLQAEAQLIAERKAQSGESSAKPAPTSKEASKTNWQVPPGRQNLQNNTNTVRAK